MENNNINTPPRHSIYTTVNDPSASQRFTGEPPIYDHSADPNASKIPTGKRSTLITVICVLNFIGVAFAVLNALVGKNQSEGSPMWSVLIGAALVLPCLIGLWMMKKWAAVMYAAFFALVVIVSVAMGQLNPVQVVGGGLVSGLVLSQWSKMS